MKRNSFLKISLTAVATLSSPFAVMAKHNRSTRNKGIKVDSGKDRFNKPISLFQGDTFYTKVSATDTDGDIYVYESTRVKEGGPALHVHYEQDEFWYILKGEFLFKVGDELFTAKSGDTVFGPRKVPHAFAKVGEEEAKLLMFFQPAGKMEEFFIAISEGKLAKMSVAEQNEFRKQHGVEVVGPALDHYKAP